MTASASYRKSSHRASTPRCATGYVKFIGILDRDLNLSEDYPTPKRRQDVNWRRVAPADPLEVSSSLAHKIARAVEIAERELSWRAVKLPELVQKMVDADLELAEREKRAGP
jgi:hypothetical protein